MGSMGYDNDKKPREQQARRPSTATMFLLVLTNAASVFVFSGAGAALHAHVGRRYPAVVHAWSSAKLLRELNATGLAVAASHAEVVDLSGRLTAANKVLEAILGGSTAKRDMEAAREEQREAAAGGLWQRELKLGGELKLVVGPHRGGGADAVTFPSLGQACHRYRDELERYMNYTVGGECPSDEASAQRLMLKGCEPLPRRRCRPRTPAGYVEPTPLPASLWAVPPDTSIVWDAYTCKSYGCLARRGKAKGSYDCKDCFDLGGREKDRWVRRRDKEKGDERNSLDYTIDGVLGSLPSGSVRIGLDIGGGSGTFAARMRERGVTVVTTSMNFDGPFNSFIASRGLVPMHLSVASRLPFFDGTLDVVHSMHVLSSWIPDAMLESALFDVFRVLRPGGVFWLDHFFCLGTQLDATYLPMFDRIGFKKLRWNAGRKLDRGIHMDEWYISALLQKPRR
ncbi:S-adenosyl-L-methionine-dependent methyltransferase superfamily protein [Zea mays]|uniref:S-adenosyl-L-methionine-dependent methyltransferase superfamily protein n=1 Tax=Zea mays TaxID=4577 RepID=A0A1D6LE95_MAIZE|nr:S-adenosyl-L-methionine-dependent methyltransferase superfamily protein [Zea mays]|eukprot:XP_008648379.1 uncharacterized protein LOC103628964 [Zea mays]